jgi:serine/threonine protein kinase
MAVEGKNPHWLVTTDRQLLPSHVRVAPYHGSVYRAWVDILSKPDFAGFEVLGTVVGNRVFWCPSALVANTNHVRVYVGIREGDGQVVAVKAYKDHICNAHVARRAMACGYATAYYEVPKFDTDNNPIVKLYLITELMEASLQDVLQTWEEGGVVGTGGQVEAVRHIAADLLHTLTGMHDAMELGDETNFPRRDLDLESVCVTRYGKIRFVDMGVTRQEKDFEPRTEYMAPEDALSTKSDVFAVGILLQSLLWGSNGAFDPACHSLREVFVLNHPHHAACAKDFIGSMTCPDPTDRATCRQLLRHPFLWPVQRCVEFLGSLAVLISEIYDEPASFYDRKRFVMVLADIVGAECKGCRWGSVFPQGYLDRYLSAKPVSKCDDAAPLELFAFVRNYLPGTHSSGPHIEGPYAATLLQCLPRLTVKCWRLLSSSPLSSTLRSHYAVVPYIGWVAPPPLPIPRHVALPPTPPSFQYMQTNSNQGPSSQPPPKQSKGEPTNSNTATNPDPTKKAKKPKKKKTGGGGGKADNEK